MRFGIQSNGFRLHTSAAQTYAEDLHELILADSLGYEEAWISEHHGQPLYINTVDTIPIPELLITQAAALTKQIRFGPAVKLAHLSHPVDVATLAATTDHLTNGRYILGIGTGFATPYFSEYRGLSFEQRHERLSESLELILKGWAATEPFDWNGKQWSGKNIVVLPKPLQQPHIPIAFATRTDASIDLAGERGYTLLGGGTAKAIRGLSEKYARAALAAGRPDPLQRITVIQSVWIADTVEEGIEDLRAAVEPEIEYRRKRGLLGLSLSRTNPNVNADEVTFDDLVKLGSYVIGAPDDVYAHIKRLYDESGGFGTLLIVTGKDWATREKRDRNLERFIKEVAPRLAHLTPSVPSESRPAEVAAVR